MARYVDAVPDVEQPRALIVTVYGLYARESGGWLPIATLVRLLADLDVDEPAVRSAISRLKRRGLIEASRRDGVAGYALSEQARVILEEGDDRIFSPERPRIADGWLLAIFSVPETERAKRHTLRSQLIALGFGAAAPGVWVAPAHRFDLTASTLARHGLSGYVDLFRAEYLAFGDIDLLTAQWWDLDVLAGAYAEFIDSYRAALDRPVEPAAAFVDWVRALTAWRRLPYRDPGLPVELLPRDWPGHAAAELVAALRARWSVPAHDFMISVMLPAGRRAD